MKTLVSLPRIIRFDHTSDSGEFGNANCPHCDAKGRYVHHFLTEDGPRAAMAGCIQLFPVAPVANEHRKIAEKARKLPEGRKLNSWDTKKLDAIQAFYAGTMTEDEALRRIAYENASCREWVAKRHGNRR